ncbi:hypothetical protein V6N11_025786 [Hibiscus sabdariffa]|uniref:Uncharacterized protein n=1 Tax=Hibiscus sabdariffa TaxID=183260 RepID=A0ABR2STN5_9ROSI
MGSLRKVWLFGLEEKSLNRWDETEFNTLPKGSLANVPSCREAWPYLDQENSLVVKEIVPVGEPSRSDIPPPRSSSSLEESSSGNLEPKTKRRQDLIIYSQYVFRGNIASDVPGDSRNALEHPSS